MEIKSIWGQWIHNGRLYFQILQEDQKTVKVYSTESIEGRFEPELTKKANRGEI